MSDNEIIRSMGNNIHIGTDDPKTKKEISNQIDRASDYRAPTKAKGAYDTVSGEFVDLDQAEQLIEDRSGDEQGPHGIAWQVKDVHKA